MKTDQAASSTANNRLNAALALSVLVIVGTFGPWASLGFISVSGINTDDGKIVFGMGLVAVIVSLVLRAGKMGGKSGRILLGILGVLIAAASAYDLNNLAGLAGWGIYLDLLAGVGLVVLAVISAKAEVS